ncbi:MAG TPA: nucleotidyltransferase domain-containing protein [Myxococcota bacterium]|nr:nucleotidyltransferase domain-containing protein [Myxococcota bacterium]
MNSRRSAMAKVISERVLSVFPEAERIVLFGSRAAGTHTRDSDYDLLIVVETALPLVERGARARLALRGIRAAFDILVVTPAELRRLAGFQSGVIANAIRFGEILHATS